MNRRITLDPKYALPYAELAGLFNQSVAMGMRSPQEILTQTRINAEKALELDPSLPEAHIQLGMAAGIFAFDWKEAGRRFALAFAHPTASSLCRFLYHSYLLAMGRPRSHGAGPCAVEEDPLNPIYRPHFAMCLWRLGRDGEALRELNRALESDENRPASHSFFAQYHCDKGAFHEALPFAEKAYALLPHFKLSATLLAGILVRTGDTARATEMLAKLGPPTAFGVSRALAQFYSITGEIEKAADWCERAIKEGDGNVAVGTTFPLYKPLRESPRWPQLAKMMNLPEGV